MAWQIDLFRVRDGQDPCKVRDVQYEWNEHEGYAVEPLSVATDRWTDEVVNLVQTFEPPFVEDDEQRSYEDGHVMHVALEQPDGPCVIHVYPNALDIRVKRSHVDKRDGDAFRTLWRCCRLLAEKADCAVFPQYDDEPTDMSMDEDEARSTHNWA